MPDDEEDELETGEVDPKKKKNKRKKKKKTASQDSHADEDEAGVDTQHSSRDYWPAPDNFMGLDERPKDEEWVDITSLCDLAVSGMNLGEMMESSSFRLYDAMSAIEIMDPKMDTGYKSQEDMTLEKAEALGLVSDQLETEVLIGLMDHLLMYYLLWLDGHTIVQTCFSCLYLQDAPRLLKPIPALGSFVDALLVTCQNAKDAVNSAGVWDDEDFMPTMFNVDFQDSSVFSTDPIKVNEKLKIEKERQQDEAILWRLDFIGKYMSALVALSRPRPSTLPSAKGLLAKCAQLLPKIEKSAKAPSDAVKKRFDASLNRKLLVPGPPRQVEPIEDPKVVFSMWAKHINELSLGCTLLTRPLGDLLEGVISVIQEDKPNVLSRSVAQLVVSDSGFVRQLLQESLETHLFPPEAMQHCKKQAEPFLQRCESMFLHMLKLTHLNRARRFRRLAHVFPDFNELQHEAYRLDDTLKSTFGANLKYSRPSWGFIMDHALQAMIAKLLIGFQLDIYEEAELHMIYWYVDYLCGLRIYYLNEIFYAKECSGGKPSRPKDALSGKGNRPKNPPLSLLLLEAMQSMVRGLFRLLAFCLPENLLTSPQSVRAGLAQRFVLRFRCLETFRLPHLPSYHDFDQSAVLAQDPKERRGVLTAAQSSFQDAAQLLEKVQGALREDGRMEVGGDDLPKALRRVVVANQLGITQLQRLDQEELSGKKVLAETVHHPEFISIQVVDK